MTEREPHPLRYRVPQPACFQRDCSWLKRCFTSTETTGLLATGVQDGHLDFHTAPELLHLYSVRETHMRSALSRWWWSRASCLRMSVDILGTNYDQCLSMVQCCSVSTETIMLVRTESPGRPSRLSHSSWTLTHCLPGLSEVLSPLPLPPAGYKNKKCSDC